MIDPRPLTLSLEDAGYGSRVVIALKKTIEIQKDIDEINAEVERGIISTCQSPKVKTLSPRVFDSGLRTKTAAS